MFDIAVNVQSYKIEYSTQINPTPNNICNGKLGSNWLRENLIDNLF
jgi:hypothetical protein